MKLPRHKTLLSFRELCCQCIRKKVARESLTNREMDVNGKSIDEAADDIERRVVEDPLKTITGTNKRRPKN
jgi:hypothetical protein